MRVPCPTCAEDLPVAAVGARTVTASGRRFPFRRRTDHVVCWWCGVAAPVTDLRAAAPFRRPAEGGAAAADPGDGDGQDPAGS